LCNVIGHIDLLWFWSVVYILCDIFTISITIFSVIQLFKYNSTLLLFVLLLCDINTARHSDHVVTVILFPFNNFVDVCSQSVASWNKTSYK